MTWVKNQILAMMPAAVLFLLLAWPFHTMGSQTDKRLDALFEQLQMTEDPNEAAVLTQAIWEIWHESEDPAVKALMQQGLHEMAQQKYVAALATFSNMIEFDSEFAEGWNKRATVYYLLGDYRASVLDIDRTLELEPRHFGALSGLGLIMLAMGNDTAALAAFESALAVNPFMPGARQHIGQIRERQKKEEL